MMTYTQLSNQEPYLIIHADGRITVSEKLKPSETSARVLECMKTQWMEDSQSKQIRELQERIKRLEEQLMDTKNKYAVLVADVVLNEDRAERIKRLEEENNELRAEEARLLNTNGELERRVKRLIDAGDAMFPWSERVGQEFWTKAKEAKL